MVSIQGIGRYVPRDREDNYSKCEKFGVSQDFIDHKIGVRKLARKGAQEDTSDLAVRAIEDLARCGGPQLDDIDCLVVCTQNPDGFGLPHTSAILHSKLGMGSNCAAFDISLGCSGYVYGLAILDGLMRCQRLKNAILVTADPYSKVVDPDDKDTSMLFGDAATATWLCGDTEAEGRNLVLKRAVFATDGAQWKALRIDTERHLRMDGRTVFNFSATVVPQQIARVMEEVGLRQESVDLYLFHQGSKYIVDTLAKRLNIPAAKIPIGISDFGNAVSSSIPLMLQNYLPEKSIKTIVLAGFGVGLSCATAVLTRGNDSHE